MTQRRGNKRNRESPNKTKSIEKKQKNREQTVTQKINAIDEDNNNMSQSKSSTKSNPNEKKESTQL